MKAKGTGTPVTTAEDITVVDFGTIYATQTINRDIMVENRGKKARKLMWTSEKLEALRKYLAKKPDEEEEKEKKKNKKKEEDKLLAMTPVFGVGPEQVLVGREGTARFGVGCKTGTIHHNMARPWPDPGPTLARPWS